MPVEEKDVYRGIYLLRVSEDRETDIDNLIGYGCYLRDNDIRVELDDRDEKMGYKLRESITRKIPMTLILGDKERDNRTISFRRYGSEETTTVSIDEFIELVKKQVEEKK